MDVIAQIDVFEIVGVVVVCGDAGAVLLRTADCSKIQCRSRCENDGDNLSRGSHSSNRQLSQSVAVDRRAARYRGCRGYRTPQLAKVVRQRVPKTLSARIAQVVDAERLEREAADHARGVGAETVGVAVIILIRTRQRAGLEICGWSHAGQPPVQ